MLSKKNRFLFSSAPLCPQPPSTLPWYLYQIFYLFFCFRHNLLRFHHFNGPFGTKLPCWRQVVIRCFQYSEMRDSDVQFNMKRHKLPSSVDYGLNSPNKSLWVAEIFVIDQNTEFNCRGVLYNRKPVSKAAVIKETHDNKNKFQSNLQDGFGCAHHEDTMRTPWGHHEDTLQPWSTQTKMFHSVHLYSLLD